MFACKDLGGYNYFLRIEILPKSRDILLSQHKYVNEVLQHARLSASKPVSTPMNTIQTLFIKGNTPFFQACSLHRNGWCLSVCNSLQTWHCLCCQQSLSIHAYSIWKPLVCCKKNHSLLIKHTLTWSSYSSQIQCQPSNLYKCTLARWHFHQCFLWCWLDWLPRWPSITYRFKPKIMERWKTKNYF